MSGLDEEDVRKCLDGRPEAFQGLVSRYQGVLMTYLAGKTQDEELAEEVAQEAFIRAFFNLRRLERAALFRSWVIGIANRVLRDYRRGQRRREVRHKNSHWMTVAHVHAQDQTDDGLLEQAVAQLPEPYREVVLLRHYGGLSCAEAAEQLGVSLSAVTKRLSRAYDMLRQSLTRLGCGP